MGALEFVIGIFGVFLVFWSHKANVIQESRDVDMGNINDWNQENSEKHEFMEEITGTEKRIREIGDSTFGITFGRLKSSGGKEQIAGKERQHFGRKSSRSLKGISRRKPIKANSKKGTKFQDEKDSNFEDKNGMFTMQDNLGNGSIRRKREKRHLQQDKMATMKKNFTETRNYSGIPSTPLQNSTCLKNCSTIRKVLHDGGRDCRCEVCCSKASGQCCKKQNSHGFGNYSIQITPNHCNCSQESSKSNRPKEDFVRFECVNENWMITSCPRHWPQDEISYKCLNGPAGFPNTTKLKVSVPVFTPDRKVFRNRYCALCNNETSFEPYEVVIECKTAPPASYSPRKAIEFLLSRCNEPRWQPQGKQASQACPGIYLSCSAGRVRVRKDNYSSRIPSDFNYVTITSSDSQSYCSKCEKIQNDDCSFKPQSNNKKFLNTVSLSFTLDLTDDAEKSISLKVSCPKEKPVYDPYLEKCRYGLIRPPKNAPFDSYRIRLFIESFTLHVEPALEDFRAFLEKELGFRVFQLRYFSQGFEFETRIVRISNNSAKIYKFKNYLNFTNQFTITINNVKLSIFKVTYRILTCASLEYYEKHEYAILHGYMPAVYLNNSGEIVRYFNYYSGMNDTISVCRLRLSNCTGVYISVEKEEYTMLKNNSITVKESGEIYNSNQYEIHNGTLWICVHFSSTYSVYKVSRRAVPLALSVITFVCKSLSIIGLVFVLVTYSLFSELRTPPGINLMNLSVSILLTQLFWILGSGQTDTPMACTVIAVILHYLFLVSFMWTSIIAFDTWRAFSAKGRRPLAHSKGQRMKHCLRHMAVGWLPVLIYVAVCVGLDDLDIMRIGYGSDISCFITGTKAKLYFFIVPVVFFIIFNFAFFVMTVRAIKQTGHQTKLIGPQLAKKHEFRIYVRIASLMGFTWIFGFAAPFGWQFLWYPFVILNSLQGVYIALAFGLGRRARKLYVDLYRGNGRGMRSRQSTSRSGRRERSTKESLL